MTGLHRRLRDLEARVVALESEARFATRIIGYLSEAIDNRAPAAPWYNTETGELHVFSGGRGLHGVRHLVVKAEERP